MSRPLFSIIIPVFNAQEYIEECLKSILKQNFDDYEIILVDDGSSDESVEICSEYASRDRRIRLIQQENAGTSAARNTGIENAAGNYITFIDNDDFWLNSDALASMAKRIAETDADLVIHESIVFHDDKDEFDSVIQPKGLEASIQAKDKAAAITELVKNQLLCSAVWTKACKRQMVVDNKIFFPIGMRNEDTFWTGKVLIHARTIAWCENVFYAYRKSHEYAQTSHSLKQSHIDDLAKICEMLVDELEGIQLEDDERRAILCFIAYPYSVLLGQSALIPRKEYQNSATKEIIEKNAWLLDYDANPQVKKTRVLKSVVGLNMTRAMLGSILRHRYKNLSFE